MSRTLGFLLLEGYFSKYKTWPISRGIRGLLPTILFAVNIISGIHSLFKVVLNSRMDVTKFLYHIKFLSISVLIVTYNIQLLRKRVLLFEMLNLLSDFNQIGVPKSITFIDKIMKTLFKHLRFALFFISHLIAFFIMFKNKCAQFMSSKHCFMFDYYIPFKLESRGITVIALFEIYGIDVALNVSIIYTLLYVYSFEVLTAKTQVLKKMISDTKLSRNKKRNRRVLRPIVLYQQNIFRVFKITKNFFVNFLVPVKMFHSICLTASITEFALRKDLLSGLTIILSFSALLISHTIGERFTTSAGKVSEMIYNMNWYEADVSTRKDVLILLSMSQKILKLELPFFGSLSHLAAAHEFNKVYVLYNWMLTITKKIN